MFTMEYLTLLSIILSHIFVAGGERITIRLVDGSSTSEGTLQVRRGSEWGLVCDDEWDLTAAKVVCKQLGYPDAVKATSYNNFRTSGPSTKIFLDDVKCYGYETNLGQCKHREWLTSNCHSGEAAGVVCKSDAIERELTGNTVEISVGYSQRTRDLLAKAQELINNGRREPSLPEQTHPVDPSPQLEIISHEKIVTPPPVERRTLAPTERNQLGLELRETLPAPEPDDHASALQGISGSIQFNKLSSAETPPSAADSYLAAAADMKKVDNLIEEMTYRQSRRVEPLPKIYGVTVVGGRRSNEGYVKVTLDNGKSGTICSDNWGIYEAMVVCRQTSNKRAERAIIRDYFKASSQDKVIYEVNCDGHERSLADCEYKLRDRHGVKCSKPINVAGVVCTSQKLPDLMPNIRALQTSLFIEQKSLYSLQCAMEENCLASSARTAQIGHSGFGYPGMFGGYGMGGSRKLLRFSSNIYNNGTADFRPHQHRSSWEWHACHQHYHSMDSFSHYDILDSHGNRVAEGHKASFCLEDVECDWGARKKYSCRGFADQGISVGCADVYKSDIDCQWVDITDLSPGAYVFKLNVNPNANVPELTYDNNAAICELSYNGYSAKLSNCVLSRG